MVLLREEQRGGRPHVVGSSADVCSRDRSVSRHTARFQISINLPKHKQEHNQSNKEAFSTTCLSETQEAPKRIEISLK